MCWGCRGRGKYGAVGMVFIELYKKFILNMREDSLDF